MHLARPALRVFIEGAHIAEQRGVDLASLVSCPIATHTTDQRSGFSIWSEVVIRYDRATVGYEEGTMGADINCYICGDYALDDCAACKLPVCTRHSKSIGDFVLCHECIAREEENG